MMKHVLIALLLCSACGKSAVDELKEKNPPPPEAPPPGAMTPPPAAAAKPAPPPAAPDPTTPADIDKARNQAMIDGKDKDVLHFCELGKLDDKSPSQALLGCTLSACRIKDVDTAKKYAHALPKALMDQAIMVCGKMAVSL
jgi:hypothetical protein